jgi:transcriptional regulator with XRE-family HTH domain
MAQPWQHSAHALRDRQRYKLRPAVYIIGRYERDIITPSIDVIIKVADALEVSIDFLVGKTNLELDSQTLKRIEEISILPADRKNYILSIIDMAIRDFKTQNAYSA